MLHYLIWRVGTRVLILSTVAALTIACTDLPSGFSWDHTYPEGLIIREDGRVKVRVDPDGNVSGGFSIRMGRSSGRLEVTFIDEDGSSIVPAVDELLEVTIALPDIATFEHTSPGSFSGRIHGVSTGQTSAFFKFRAITSLGGAQWTSPAIAVDVGG